MNALLAIVLLVAQEPAALVEKLEAKAASVRGLRFRSRADLDALGGDEIVERTCSSGFVEVTPDGSVWDEYWAALIGPERRSTTTFSIRTLTTSREWLQHYRSAGGFEPKMTDKRLQVHPMGGAWAAYPGIDPVSSRERTYSADAVNPLLLYALIPALLRTEAELRLAKEDEAEWILEARRTVEPGTLTKRFRIRKKDLALVHVLIERKGPWGVSGFDYEATEFESVKDLTVPSAVTARYLDWAELARWTTRWDPKAPKAAERSRKDFPDPLFVAPVEFTQRDVQLRQLINPADPQLLADLAWGRFDRNKWEHYVDTRQKYRGMLKTLRELAPGNYAAREDWFARTWNADRDEAFMRAESPAPLFNAGIKSLAAGNMEEAEQTGRAGLAAAGSAGDRLIWTCLLCAALQGRGNLAEATTLWLDLAAALDDGTPSTQVFLTEIALGRGLMLGFDAAVLSKKPDLLAAALPLVSVGKGAEADAALRSCMAVPTARSLASEIMFDASPEVVKEIAGIADVDAILAAAWLQKSHGKDIDDLCEAAIALWEKEAYCRLWTWDVWGRTTLRMLRRLRSFGQQERALRLALKFIDRCAEGKVSMWLGYYRWGELVGDCLNPLREEEKQTRFVDALAKSPELASRLAFRHYREESFLPLDEMVAHLKKSRDRAEAHGWIEMAETFDIKGEALRPLATLAHEIAPGDLRIENATADVMGNEMPIEKRADLLRRTITAARAGTYRDRTGGNWGMIYEKLAETYVAARKYDEAAETAREMMREYPTIDSMTVINLAYKIGGAGRKDLEKALYIAAARHNAHRRPFAAQVVIERLEPLGESSEIYALAIRTLASPMDPSDGDRNSERTSITAIQKARGRASANVKWEDVLQPWFDQPRAPLAANLHSLATQAIEDLQADESEKRVRAGRILLLLGDGAVPLLRKPAMEGAPEEKSHARAILERIYADEWK